MSSKKSAERKSLQKIQILAPKKPRIPAAARRTYRLWFAAKPKVPTRRAEGSPPYGCGTVIAPILPTCVGRGAPTPPRIPHQPPTPRRRGAHRPPAPAPQREFQSCRRHTALLTSSLLPIPSISCQQRGVEDAAPYKGARHRLCTVGDGVPDVPLPRRSGYFHRAEGTPTLFTIHHSLFPYRQCQQRADAPARGMPHP